MSLIVFNSAVTRLVPNENAGIGRFRKSNTERRRNTFVFTLGLKEERTNVNKIKGL